MPFVIRLSYFLCLLFRELRPLNEEGMDGLEGEAIFGLFNLLENEGESGGGTLDVAHINRFCAYDLFHKSSGCFW